MAKSKKTGSWDAGKFATGGIVAMDPAGQGFVSVGVLDDDAQHDPKYYPPNHNWGPAGPMTHWEKPLSFGSFDLLLVAFANGVKVEFVVPQNTDMSVASSVMHSDLQGMHAVQALVD